MDLLKNLNNMITAKLILTGKETYDSEYSTVSKHDALEAMIEFAKLHVEAALKTASENFKMKLRDDVHELDMNDDWMEVDKNSILNAYNLDNIK